MKKISIVWVVFALLILAGCEMIANAPTPESIAAEKLAEQEAEAIIEEVSEPVKNTEPKEVIITSEPVEKPEIVEEVREPLPEYEAPKEPEMQVHYIDVGQGDSTLIIMPNNETMLIDCGPDGSGKELIEYFRSVGVKDIDLMIGTHPDPEHIGGCDEVMQGFPVAKVMENGHYQHNDAYLNFRETAKQRQHQVLTKDEYDYQLDPTVNIDILTPYNKYYKYDQYPNDNSIVVVINYGLFKFLFTGDCEFRCEDAVLKENIGEIDFYKVGNHGDKVSTTMMFLSSITPKISIISAGADNEQGLPHKDTLTRLRLYHSKIFSTVNEGTIVVKAQARDYRMSTD